MNAAQKQREELIQAMAKLEAQRRAHHEARARLVDHAKAQLDSMPRTVHMVGQHVEAGEGGGILAQRRLQTLLTERQRLEKIVFPAK